MARLSNALNLVSYPWRNKLREPELGIATFYPAVLGTFHILRNTGVSAALYVLPYWYYSSVLVLY